MKRVFCLLLLFSLAFLGLGCQSAGKSDEGIPASTTPVTEDKNSGGSSEENMLQGPINGHNPEDYAKVEGDWKLKIGKNEELYRLTAMLEYLGSTGINITAVNGNEIQGNIYSINGPPSYRQAEVAFSGVIKDGVLRTTYEDTAWDYTGVMELSFEEGRIVADISRDVSESPAMWGIPEGVFVFIKAIETEKMEIAFDDKEEIEAFLYTVPALGEVLEPLKLQLLLRDMENSGIYYAIVDYLSVSPAGDTELESQYFVKFHKGDNYTLKDVKEVVDYPIEFALFDF